MGWCCRPSVLMSWMMFSTYSSFSCGGWAWGSCHRMPPHCMLCRFQNQSKQQAGAVKNDDAAFLVYGNIRF